MKKTIFASITSIKNFKNESQDKREKTSTIDTLALRVIVPKLHLDNCTDEETIPIYMLKL